MNEIVFKGANNQVLTNSLLVAEKFGKLHKNVIQVIKELITSAEKSANLFVESAYPDAYGRMQPMYIMNRDGFALLVMGFTGDKALQFKLDYIEAFNKMEETIKNGGFQIPANFRDALLLAAKQQEQIEEQQKQISCMSSEIVEMKKKTDYLDIILSSRSTVVTTQIAQDYGMSAKKFNKLLAELKIQHKVNGQWILYAPYMTKGYVRSKSVNIVRSDGRTDVRLNTEWTQRGRLFLYEKLKAANVLPLIERAA